MSNFTLQKFIEESQGRTEEDVRDVYEGLLSEKVIDGCIKWWHKRLEVELNLLAQKLKEEISLEEFRKRHPEELVEVYQDRKNGWEYARHEIDTKWKEIME